MPRCSIKQCNATKDTDRPTLTLHRIPSNIALREQWLDVIGAENLNANHQRLYICSLHFKESDFNRTMDVVRLHENVVPSRLVSGAKNTETSVLFEVSNGSERISPILPQAYSKKQIFSKVRVSLESHSSGDEMLSEKDHQKTERLLTKFQHVCAEQRKKIKRLEAKLSRKKKTIENLLLKNKELTKKIVTDKDSILLLVGE